MWYINWLLPLFGFLVGLLVGLTGMGGAVVMTPLLLLGLGLPPSMAVGTDLAYAALKAGRRVAALAAGDGGFPGGTRSGPG